MAEELDRTWEIYGHTAGGLVYSLNPLDQARLLAVQFHRLVFKASEAGIPLVFPVFPRIATDWRYLHECLQPILPLQVTDSVARAAHGRVADAGKVRVTGEIAKDTPTKVIYGRMPRLAPQYPSPSEVDNIALRREIGRLRQELKQQASTLELSALLGGEISELRAAKLELEQTRSNLEATIEGLRNKLKRKTIKHKMRRLLWFAGAGPA